MNWRDLTPDAYYAFGTIGKSRSEVQGREDAKAFCEELAEMCVSIYVDEEWRPVWKSAMKETREYPQEAML